MSEREREREREKRERERESSALQPRSRYSVYLLYTKVQILTCRGRAAGKKKDVWVPQSWFYSVYLLYWYKGTNTDVQRPRSRREEGCVGAAELVLLSLFALLVQRYKY